MKQYGSPPPLFTVRVKVPASTANLGPGFDVLGLALEHHNEVELSAWEKPVAPPLALQVEGEGATQLPLNHTNLVARAARRALEKIGRRLSALRLRLVNRIPLARGLGSSSAAIVGGLVAVNAGLGSPLSQEDLLRLAADMEGHPDNVAPALLGGLCVSAAADGRVHCLSLKEPGLFRGLSAVVCVPSFELSTEKARHVLPDRVSRADAVFNGARVALFLAALQQRRHDLLQEAMEDRLHQPYRKKLVPGFDEVLAAARKAGAWGAALSGAGPSVLALSPKDRAAAVGEAMSAAFRRREVSSLWLDLKVSARGARAVKL